MATFLVNAFGLVPSDDNGVFTDHLGSVHRRNINALRLAGITTGCNPPDNTSYCPHRSVTREQMATFLVRALGLMPNDDDGAFADHLSSVHRRNINALRAAGITQGCNPPANTLFCPKDPVRRDQMATFIARAKGWPPKPPPPVKSFGDGIWIVGTEVVPGRYRNASSSNGCYWARLSGLGGTFAEIIANEFTFEIHIVDIDGTDVGFESDDCGPWTNRLTPRTLSPLSDFDGGHYLVGTEVAATRWRNTDSSGFCFWERLSGFSGRLSETLSNEFTSEIQIVDIAATDVGFGSEDCGTWSRDLTPRTSSPTAGFSGGDYLVGSEIAPGIWRNSDSSGFCYWERLSGFSGEFAEIIANGFSDAIQTVEIKTSDVGFSSEDCGSWTKIG